ncbi:MAG: segregation and condensation protein A [Chloroflexota bacterium]
MAAAATLALTRFEGPLDLLSQLIDRKELDITTVSLAAVAEDFLREVAALGETDLERLAGYLTMASRLLLIKSQALLPRRPPPEIEEDAQDLVRQLEEYRRFKDLATSLRELAEGSTRLYARQTVGGFTQSPPTEVVPASLLVGALLRAVSRAPIAVPTEIMPLAQFPVAAQIARLEELLTDGEVVLDDLVRQSTCRQAVIAIFLALLEMLRLGRIVVSQSGLFGPVLLSFATVTEPDDSDDTQGGAESIYDDVG